MSTHASNADLATAMTAGILALRSIESGLKRGEWSALSRSKATETYTRIIGGLDLLNELLIRVRATPEGELL